MTNIIITQPATIKAYFEKMLQLKSTGETFPIDLDDVWALVYAQKVKAVEALRQNFFEGEDYNLSQNGKVIHSTEIRNGIAVTYKLSVSCLEYFIARKVREVFNVYREVFHKVVETQKELSRMEILQLAMQAEQEKEAMRLEIGELAPKAASFDRFMSSEETVTMEMCAKLLSERKGTIIGRNKLFDFLRQKRILQDGGKQHNVPYQSYIDRRYFNVIARTWKDPESEKEHLTFETLVYPQGVDYIQKLLTVPV